MCYMGWVSDRELPQYLKVLSSALRHLNLTEWESLQDESVSVLFGCFRPRASHSFTWLSTSLD